MQELASKYQVHPNQMSMWTRKASDGLVGVFARDAGGSSPELER